MKDRKLVVATHGHCFDGLVSAVLFTHLRRELDPGGWTVKYLSCGYGPGMQTVPERWLKGDENAIVDFRFTPSERLTWFFDHHPTAFGSDEEQQSALERTQRVFYDPSYDSCAKLIADVGHKTFGIDFARFSTLVDWANRIDGALFSSAAEALDRTEPVQQLASVVEQHGHAALLATLADRLLTEPFDRVARSEPVAELWAPLAEAHLATRQRIAQGAQQQGQVVYVDLHEAPLQSSGKFHAYALFPGITYSVSLLRMRQHFKLSLGYNPWATEPRQHDIAALCRRHGGGGHADVGAASFALDKLAAAQSAARVIVEELNG